MRIFSPLRLLNFFLLFSGLCRAQTAELKTAETQIALEAGAEAPRLVSYSFAVDGRRHRSGQRCAGLTGADDAGQESR